MENETQQCNEIARLTLPWGSKIVNYCPVHANRLAIIGQAMGVPMNAQLLPKTSSIQCEQMERLTDKEKELAKTFDL